MKLVALTAGFTLAFAIGCGPEPIQVQCNQSVKDVKESIGEQSKFAVNCPANCPAGSIWGTDIYTTDSSICTAAKHAGVIKDDGGKVEVELLPGQDSYQGSERNGVKTGDWNSYPGSYKVK